jgi:hypothetical protein
MTVRISHTTDATAGEKKHYSTLELEFGDDTPPEMVKFIILELLIGEPEVTYSLDETFDHGLFNTDWLKKNG